MSKPFFDRRGKKRRFSGAKARLYNKLYRKMVKTVCRFIFVVLLNKYQLILTKQSTPYPNHCTTFF